jgi:hypothetical protein
MEHNGGKGATICTFSGFIRRTLTILGWSFTTLLQKKLYNDESCTLALADRVRTWLLDGLDATTGDLLEKCRCAMLQRICPPDDADDKQAKRAGPHWWTAIALLHTACFAHQCRHLPFRTRFRELLRCLPPVVQRALWTQDYQCPEWPFGVDILMSGFGLGEYFPESGGVVYGLLDTKSDSWYIGRTKMFRKAGAKLIPGIGVRCKEHFSNCFQNHHSLQEPKYKRWRKSTPNRLYMVPIISAPPGSFELLEELLIRRCGPTFQKQLGATRLRPRRPHRRVWPRLRAPPTWTTELGHNQLWCLADGRSDRVRWRLWEPWTQFLANRNLAERYTQNVMYSGCIHDMDALTVWAGSKGKKLDWKRMWAGGGARPIAYKLWRWAGFLPPDQRRRAREKVLRFLQGTDAAKAIVIEIPTTRPSTVAIVRRCVREAAADIYKYENNPDRAFMLTRMLLYRQVRPRKGIDLMADHYRVAKQTSLDFYHSTPSDSAEIYMRYGDCQLTEDHCSLPLAEHTPSVCKQVADDFARWCGQCSPDTRFQTDAARNLQTLLHQRLFPSRGGEHRNQYCSDIRRECHEDMQRCFGVPIPNAATMVVPVDRDLRRRCCCSTEGYRYRLMHTFLTAVETYQLSTYTSVEDACSARTRLAITTLQGLISKKIRAGLCSAYTLPKRKCFEDGRWACTRDHEHQRVIVAAPRDRIAYLNRRGARALLVLVRRKGILSCAVHNQMYMHKEIQGAHAALRDPGLPTCTGCGGPKEPLCRCKLDASSFFTRCPRAQCIRLAMAVLDEFAQRGATHVWLSKDRTAPDRLGCSQRGPPERFTAFPLEDLRKLLQFCLADNLVAVGTSIWHQLQGLGQGNAFSPVLSRLLLDISHHRLWKQPSTIKFQPIQRALLRQKPREIIATKFHVDDSIWWSFMLCEVCIFGLVQALWPPEIGLTNEGTTSTLTFLHVDLEFEQARPYRIIPHARNVNHEFAMGSQESLPVCGLPPWTPGVTTVAALQTTFHSRLWLLAGTYRKPRAPEGAYHVVLLVLELLRLRWPTRDIVRQLCSYNNYRNRSFAKLCASCGTWMRQQRHLLAHTVDLARRESQLWKFIGIKMYKGLGFPDQYFDKYYKQ